MTERVNPGATTIGPSALAQHDEVIVDVSDRRRIRITRPRDMLHFHLKYENFVLDPDAHAPTLMRAAGSPATLIFEFPSQHLAERPYRDYEAIVTPVNCLCAGPSWLVFRVPATKPELDRIRLANLGALLSWGQFKMVVPAGGPTATRPTGTETALEIPYHLFVAPVEHVNHGTRWIHDIAPEIRGDRAQLWMTRYGARDKNGRPRVGAQHLRAFAQDPSEPLDWALPADPPGHHLAMTAQHRAQIVALTSEAYANDDASGLVEFRELALSARGAWMRVRGEWHHPNIGLTNWSHSTTGGRDHHVRLVTRGVLVPSGHPAVWIEITERYFKRTAHGEVAVLIKKEFAIPTKRRASYRGHPRPYSGRTMPLASLDIVTESSPPVEREMVTPKAWWCKLDGKPARFNFLMSGVDDEGREVRFDLPMLFVVDDVDVAVSMTAAAEAFRAAPPAVRTRDTGMATLQFVPIAEGHGSPDEGSALDAKTLTFSTLLARELAPGDWPANAAAPTSPYYLHVESATIRLPGAAHLTGNNELSQFTYFDGYKRSGLGSLARGGNVENVGQVFGTLANGPVINFSQNGMRSGGIATPDLKPTALSRKYGVVIGDPGAFGKGSFDPSQFGATAKLFGVVPMNELVEKGSIEEGLPADPANPSQRLSKAPKLGTRLNPDGSLVSTVDYKTFALASWPANAPTPIFEAARKRPTEEHEDSDTWLHLHVEVATGGPNNTQLSEVSGDLHNFALVLKSIVRVSFKSVTFSAGHGGFKLDPSLDKVTFLGSLEALQKLAEKILGSKKDALLAPRVELLDGGIFAGLKLRLPDVPVGAFSFSHMNLFGGIVLSLHGAPIRFRWAFASPQLPFLVTVGIFGGGGFFLLSLGPDGLEDLAVAIEFGGAFKLSLGVAQGEAHLLGGLYYSFDARKDSTFRAYVRAGGSLDVLEILTVSTEFYLGLEYRSGVLTGRCSLTVTIEILFFSVSVDLVMEKTLNPHEEKLLAGSGEPKSLADLMTARQWDEYWSAFAS